MKTVSWMLALLIVTALSMNAAPRSHSSETSPSRLVTGSQQSTTSQGSSTEPVMSMPLVAPLFIADANTSNTLTLVHDLEMAITVDVRVVDLAGNVVGDFSQTIPPHAQVAINMNDRLEKLGAQQPIVGSVSVNPGGVKVQLGAQLSLVRNTEPANDIEEELVMLNSSTANLFRSVASGVTRSPIVAIANLASKAQNVSVSCLQQGRSSVFNRLQVAASHTILVNGCSQSASVENATGFDSSQSDLDHPSATVGLSVESDGAPGTLAIFGIAPRTFSVYEAMPFVQTGMLQSSGSTYPGVPVGITQPIGSKQFVPELGVANFGFKPANIELLYSSAASASDAPQEIVNISIPPLSSADVPIPDLSADPRMQNSFSVVTDADNGQVISTLHSRSTDAEQIVDLPDQDQKKLANGGQHPWIVDRNTSSYLLLYNADKSLARDVGVTLYADTGRFSKTVHVNPGHTVALSVDDFINEMKSVKSSDIANPRAGKSQPSQRGIITWLSLDASTVFGRMLQINNQLSEARSFSCTVEYIACGAYIQPSNINLNVGGTATAQGYAYICPSSGQCTCDGSGACTNFSEQAPHNYWTLAANSAQFNGSNSQPQISLIGNHAGSTELNLGVQDNSSYQCSAGTDGIDPAHVFVDAPDHVSVVLDQEGYPAACPNTGIYVREMQMQLVDSGGTATNGNPIYSIQESYQNLSTNTCGNGSPNPSGCAAADSGNTFTDTLAVSGNFCNSGINPASGCGFSLISIWSVCSNNLTNTLWNSPRTTLSNQAIVNGSGATFSRGTNLH